MASAALGTSSEVNVTMKFNGYRREAEKESSGNLARQYTVTAQRKNRPFTCCLAVSAPRAESTEILPKIPSRMETNCLTSLPLQVFLGLPTSGLLTSMSFISRCLAKSWGSLKPTTYTIILWHNTAWHSSQRKGRAKTPDRLMYI